MRNERGFFVACMFELSLGLMAVGLGSFFGANPHAWMPRLSEWSRLGYGIGIGLAAGASLAAVAWVMDRLQWAWLEHASALAEKGLSELLAGCHLGHVITLSLAAGVGEELLFRGWLQGSLQIWMGDWGMAGTILAIAISSLAFGFMHPLSRGYIALAAAMGAVFGVMTWWTENLLVAIAAHAAYDAILLTQFARKFSAV